MVSSSPSVGAAVFRCQQDAKEAWEGFLVWHYPQCEQRTSRPSPPVSGTQQRPRVPPQGKRNLLSCWRRRSSKLWSCVYEKTCVHEGGVLRLGEEFWRGDHGLGGEPEMIDTRRGPLTCNVGFPARRDFPLREGLLQGGSRKRQDATLTVGRMQNCLLGVPDWPPIRIRQEGAKTNLPSLDRYCALAA